MKAVVLAAGYATRLEPLTLKTPKSLLKVGGRTMLDRILEKLGALSCRAGHIYIVTNAKFIDNFRSWHDSHKSKDSISILNDGTQSNENRLGAIMDLKLVIKEGSPDDDLLVIAGDNLFDFELDKFMKFAASHTDGVSIALFDVNDRALAKNYGVVEIDRKNRIVRFAEKPQAPQSSLVSTGIYYFPEEKLKFIDEYIAAGEKLDAPGYYISWLIGRDRAYGFTFKEDWYDIGTIDSYKKADKEYFDKEKKRG